MKTRCPHCETLYDIDEAALAAVDYTTVCCQCHQIFTAEKLNESKESVAPQHDDEQQENPLADADDTTETKIESRDPSSLEQGEENDWAFVQHEDMEKSNNPTLALATDVPEDFSSLAAAELPDHHINKPQKSKKKLSLSLIAGVFLLGLIAAAQIAWINKPKLLEHPQGRLWLQEFCDLAGCELEQQKATDKFTVLHRNLQPSISHQPALSFTLSFTNDAEFSQQLPVLQVSLLDHRDQLLAQRSFAPDEYLDPATRVDRSMKPREIINVELLLQATNLNISGFTLDFL